MIGSWLKRGALAGAAGGLASAITLLALGERSISDAIAIEEAAAGPHADPPLFSRMVQLVGGATGAVLVGLAIGVIFAVVFVAVRHRLPGTQDPARSLALAAAGFASLYLVPWFKYPPNPPAVGDPSTIEHRTLAYLALLAVSVLAVLAGWRASHELRRHTTTPELATAGGVAVWAGLVVLAWVVMPGSPDSVTAPATLVWRFRLASLAGASALWLTLGLVFGILRSRGETGRSGRRDLARVGRQPR